MLATTEVEIISAFSLFWVASETKPTSSCGFPCSCMILQGLQQKSETLESRKISTSLLFPRYWRLNWALKSTKQHVDKWIFLDWYGMSAVPTAISGNTVAFKEHYFQSLQVDLLHSQEHIETVKLQVSILLEKTVS